MVAQELGQSRKVTVVIPTYNGQQFLGSVLAALASQTLPGTCYEVVVVDNNSTLDLFAGPGTQDALAALRQQGVGFKCVPELRQGLVFARIRGVQAAAAPIVCFLDDDNVPEPDYLEQGIQAFSDQIVGILVSRVFPHYVSRQPPASMSRRENLLAINHELGETEVRFGATPTLAPTLGAGMWVRRQAFVEALPINRPHLLVSDRTGTQMMCGGDIELGLLVGKAGYDRVYQPKLRLHHYIPESRLQTKYFCRLITGIVRSELTLQRKYGFPKSRLNSLKQSVSLLTALLASPALLLRTDGLREWLFVLVSRWARLRGPYCSDENRTQS